MSTTLPLSTRFQLGASITTEQAAFFDAHGFLVFDRVASLDEVAMIKSELARIQASWLAEDRREVNGIPVFWGKGLEGEPLVQRFTFTSTFSDAIKRFVTDSRFEPIRQLVGPDARIGHTEMDGVVVNRNLNIPGSAYPRLGWHTDGLRDLAYLRMPQAMFNVGLHLDRVDRAKGGLRLIPGSHKQGFFAMCFRMPYFIWHREDPAEICVETHPGDLTVHDGRLWHRVAASTVVGAESLRHSMYVPYQTGPPVIRDSHSKMPIYHRIGRLLRWLRSLI